MKTPLSYQISEYDCGPITLQNAISFLFDRKQIYPDLIKSIHMYCMDSFNKRGEVGKYGTSKLVMGYFGCWLNEYGKCRKLPIHCENLPAEDILIARHSRIAGCLQSGGCAIARVHYGTDHYILLTGIDLVKEQLEVFDPYYRDQPYHINGIEFVNNAPDRMNRRISWGILNNPKKTTYALGSFKSRECMLLYNTTTYQKDLSDYVI